jgi:protein-S-isoprenylcysteine O-methyltransferase Ste14
MYSAIVMWCVAVVMVLPSLWVAATSVAVAVVIVTRTALEDAMLTRGLAGYEEYRRAVRWRLVPFVW